MKRARAKAELKQVQKTSVLLLDVSGMGMLFCFCTKLYLSILWCNKILLLLNELRLQKV